MTSRHAKSNIALLTEGETYIQRAKKLRREQIESIEFDDEARRSVLSPHLPAYDLIKRGGT